MGSSKTPWPATSNHRRYGEVTTSRGKGHARRRRAVAASDVVGATIGDAIAEIGHRAQTRFVTQARSRVSMAVGDQPTPQVDPQGMFDEAIWVEAVADAEDQIGEFVVDEMSRVGGTARITQPFVQEIVVAHIAEIEEYGGLARLHVEETLIEAFRDGASIDKAAAKLVAGNMTPRAAELVARTEMVSAGNGAAMVGARAVAGPRDRKIWLATPDRKTRPEHEDADGQEVPLDQPFLVGGEEADYPCHSSLSLNMRCNCRCSWYLVEG